MSYTALNAEIAKIDDKASLICQAINAWASRNGHRVAFIPRQTLVNRNQMIHPDFEVVMAEFNSNGRVKRDPTKKVSYVKSYSFKGVISDYVSLISCDDKGDIYITREPDEEPRYAGTIHDLSIVEPEWKEAAPKVEKKEEPVSYDYKTAPALIEQGMRDLDVKMKAPFSHAGKRTFAPCYVQTLTEYAVALAKSSVEIGSCYLPTHLRTLMPLPYGGIDNTRIDSKGFTQEDRVQMKGNDFQKLPTTLAPRKLPHLSGDAYDVKLISSVSSPFYKCVPVEAFYEDRTQTDPLKRFEYEDTSLWTWSKKHTADIVFVLRNRAYFVRKSDLRSEVKKRFDLFVKSGYEQTEFLKPNTLNSDITKVKWNAYLTEEELERISFFDTELPEIYGDLLEANADDLIDIYSGENGDKYTYWHIKNFNQYI